jgi:hypothetical protein
VGHDLFVSANGAIRKVSELARRFSERAIALLLSWPGASAK